jgi:hypothetical protein
MVISVHRPVRYLVSAPKQLDILFCVCDVGDFSESFWVISVFMCIGS